MIYVVDKTTNYLCMYEKKQTYWSGNGDGDRLVESELIVILLLSKLAGCLLF